MLASIILQVVIFLMSFLAGVGLGQKNMAAVVIFGIAAILLMVVQSII